MADVVIRNGPPRTPTLSDDTFEIEIQGADGGWANGAFSRIPGPASWADAGFVWQATTTHADGRQEVSVWAISGVLRAASPSISNEALLEFIIAEYRRRFDEVATTSGVKVVLKGADVTRLTSATAPLERIGREIDQIVFNVARRLPAVQRLERQGGADLLLDLDRPTVWPVESVGLQGHEEIVNFHATYEQLVRKRVTSGAAAQIATQMRRIIRLGGVARRWIWVNGSQEGALASKYDDAYDIYVRALGKVRSGTKLQEKDYGTLTLRGFVPYSEEGKLAVTLAVDDARFKVPTRVKEEVISWIKERTGATSPPIETSPTRDNTDHGALGMVASQSQQPEKREPVPNPRDVFVVHGRDKRYNEFFFDLLRRLGLNPIEFDEAIARTGSTSPYVADVVKKGLAEAQAFVVLFTGDDVAQLNPDLLGPGEKPEASTPQPRPNVILEAGMALAVDRDRTIIVEVPPLRGMSDLGGVHTVRFAAGDAPERNRLVGRLKAAQCDVNTAGSSWLELPFPPKPAGK